MKLTFLVLKGKYSIYRFKNESGLSGWIYSSDFYSITKTKDELSVVAAYNDSVPDDVPCSKDWKILKVSGPLDFYLTGIIADIANTLKEKNIPIFTLSTYDTDYILLKKRDLSSGIKALQVKGHIVSREK